jgi:hypothetical protein
MNKKKGQLLSRREFAQRAAMLSATAALVPAEIYPPAAIAATAALSAQDAAKLPAEGQAEAEARYQQILSLYGSRFDDQQRASMKKMCEEFQPMLERIRGFQMTNGDAPALYLKPLVEREKKPHPGSNSTSSGNSKKP